MPEPQPPKPSLLASGQKFAKAEADNTLTVEGSKDEGVTGTLSTTGATEHVAWSFGVWVRRKFQRNGTSAGVKGEIKF